MKGLTSGQTPSLVLKIKTKAIPSICVTVATVSSSERFPLQEPIKARPPSLLLQSRTLFLLLHGSKWVGSPAHGRRGPKCVPTLSSHHLSFMIVLRSPWQPLWKQQQHDDGT